MTKTFIYRSEDIFEDIKNDEKNVLMNIPPEVAKIMNWNAGDVLRVKIEESGSISVIKINNE
jgi:hypothetical protein